MNSNHQSIHEEYEASPMRQLEAGKRLKKVACPFLLYIAAFFLFAIWGATATVYLASGEAATNDRLQQKILELMENLTFDFEGSNEFCQSFCRSFQVQAELEYLEPIIQTDDFQNPALETYKKKCPNLELNAVVGDQFGNLYYGTRHFKLYQVDINNQPADGKEYLIYFDTVVTSKVALEALADPRTRGSVQTYGGGEFYWVDFEGCEIRGGVPVDQFGGFSKGIASYNGIVRYKGKHHIFDLYPSGANPGVPEKRYFLSLWSYAEEKGKFQLVCSARLKRAERKK